MFLSITTGTSLPSSSRASSRHGLAFSASLAAVVPVQENDCTFEPLKNSTNARDTPITRGWVDYVVISTWNNTDPQLRVDEFARFTRPAGVDTVVEPMAGSAEFARDSG